MLYSLYTIKSKELTYVTNQKLFLHKDSKLSSLRLKADLLKKYWLDIMKSKIIAHDAFPMTSHLKTCYGSGFGFPSSTYHLPSEMFLNSLDVMCMYLVWALDWQISLPWYFFL